MKHSWFLRMACSAIFALALVACERKSDEQKPVTEVSPPPPVVTVSGADQEAAARTEIERGKYLVTIGGCNDCHTAKKMGPKGPEPDESKLLAGHLADEKLPPPPKPSGGWIVVTTGSLTAWSGPWGMTYAANLTPDKDTGLGNWTEKQFKQALKTGKHLGGEGSREILPPMPWFNYAMMTDADFKAVFAYLRSIPAVSNAVPPPVPSPPRHD
jgi:mono/diheme cytochrome c family protein